MSITSPADIVQFLVLDAVFAICIFFLILLPPREVWACITLCGAWIVLALAVVFVLILILLWGIGDVVVAIALHVTGKEKGDLRP